MKARRSIALLVTFLLVFVLGVTTVLAANPHFIRASASINNAGNLVVKWKEAGLGNNQNIDYLASATASGYYACINKGGNHPQASNKEAFQSNVNAGGTFNSGQNGQISAQLVVHPPSSSLNCPGNQVRVLACVTYTNVSLKDVTNDVTAPISGSYSKTLFPLPECP